MASSRERRADPGPQFATVNEQLVSALRGRILSGSLPPGSALPEVRLSGDFGVSRNTLREAVRALVNDGLVEQHRHRTATVIDLTADDAGDLFAVRRLLELTALERLEAAWPEETGVVDAAFLELEAELGSASDPVANADVYRRRPRVSSQYRRVAPESSPASELKRIKYELAFCTARVATDEPAALAADRILAEHEAIRDAILDQGFDARLSTAVRPPRLLRVRGFAARSLIGGDRRASMSGLADQRQLWGARCSLQRLGGRAPRLGGGLGSCRACRNSRPRALLLRRRSDHAATRTPPRGDFGSSKSCSTTGLLTTPRIRVSVGATNTLRSE